jgi:hypothetical protein
MNVLPDPEVRGEIKFVFAKSLPYATRIGLIIALILFGLAAQYFLSAWIGLAPIFAASCLGMIRGYAAAPVPKGDERWERVTPDEYAKVRRKQKELEKWDADVLDVTSGRGCGCLLLVAAGLGLFFLIALAEDAVLLQYLLIDAAILTLPHWIIGSRTYLRKDDLIIKIDMLEKMLGLLKTPSDIQVSPMLSTVATGDGGRMPHDARLMVKFVDAPEWFLGLQIQLSINSVQGTSFPYLYCVLVARPEGGIHRRNLKPVMTAPPKKGLFPLFGGGAPDLLVEKSTSDGMEVVVIRQRTTRQSGFHTNDFASGAIVLTAVATARRALGIGDKSKS